jgi:hypothetical protein
MIIPIQAYISFLQYQSKEISLLPYECMLKSDYIDYTFIQSFDVYSQLLLF